MIVLGIFINESTFLYAYINGNYENP